MLDTLFEVEKELPDLLNKNGWRSLRIDYKPPFVHRVWQQRGDIRVCLHKIFATDEEVFYHPHKWPSAMRVITGHYEMKIGVKDKILTTIHLQEGSAYEMVDPDVWHSVRPCNLRDSDYSLSLMIMGPCYEQEVEMPVKPEGQLHRLEKDVINDTLAAFRVYYAEGVLMSVAY